MPKPPKSANPFYPVLLVVGVAFVLTACCYFVMTIKGRDLSLGSPEAAGSEQFVQLIDRYGFSAMMIELGVLAAATFAAIATDEFWARRAATGRLPEEEEDDLTLDETQAETVDESTALRSD